MKKFLLLSLFFLLLTLLFTYPAVFHLNDKIIGDGGDSYQFLGLQYVANWNYDRGLNPFGKNVYWRYPVGFNFSSGSDSPILNLTGILLYRFFDSILKSYQNHGF